MNNKTNWIHHLLVLPYFRIESLCLSLWIYGFQILCRFTNHRQCSLFSTQIVSVLVDGFYSLLTWPIDLWKCPCFLAHKDLPGSSCSFLHHHRIRLFPKWPLFSFSEKKNCTSNSNLNPTPWNIVSGPFQWTKQEKIHLCLNCSSSQNYFHSYLLIYLNSWFYNCAFFINLDTYEIIHNQFICFTNNTIIAPRKLFGISRNDKTTEYCSVFLCNSFLLFLTAFH